MVKSFCCIYYFSHRKAFGNLLKMVSSQLFKSILKYKLCSCWVLSSRVLTCGKYDQSCYSWGWETLASWEVVRLPAVSGSLGTTATSTVCLRTIRRFPGAGTNCFSPGLSLGRSLLPSPAVCSRLCSGRWLFLCNSLPLWLKRRYGSVYVCVICCKTRCVNSSHLWGLLCRIIRSALQA